jgi:hypothetical protein
MMFVNFDCDWNYHDTLSDCSRPSGVTTALISTSCTRTSNALGILCARELIANNIFKCMGTTKSI